MLEAYARLRLILEDRGLTVPELQRQIRRAGYEVNLKSLYRLSKDNKPLERLDLRVAAVICKVCRIPLTDLITFAPPRQKLRRLSSAKQKRLDVLMTRNSAGQLTREERSDLRELVREAEEITLHNARLLARQRERVTAG